MGAIILIAIAVAVSVVIIVVKNMIAGAISDRINKATGERYNQVHKDDEPERLADRFK